jgi:hypothetical protein
MTFALIAALIATVAAFAWLLDRKDARAHTEREAHRAETADLLQRIQAPEVAVVQHQIAQSVEAPQPSSPEDDEAYWRDAEEHRRMIAEIEALENAPMDWVR